jgi:diaminopimelate epimerase
VVDPTASAEWFMDYRNADGSLAELCGNGVRVYARYLVEAGLAAGPTIEILTRAGTVTARVADDVVAVDMPVPVLVGSGAARLSTVDYPGRVVRCGNPNLVCRVDDPATLDLTRPVSLDPDELPDGANVEFVGPTEFVDDEPRVAMRVVERGVGETLSCGSGACAVAAAVLADAGRVAGPVVVDVPGGRLRVAVGPASCVLTGPAVIVAAGEVRLWESG